MRATFSSCSIGTYASTSPGPCDRSDATTSTPAHPLSEPSVFELAGEPSSEIRTRRGWRRRIVTGDVTVNSGSSLAAAERAKRASRDWRCDELFQAFTEIGGFIGCPCGRRYERDSQGQSTTRAARVCREPVYPDFPCSKSPCVVFRSAIAQLADACPDGSGHTSQMNWIAGRWPKLRRCLRRFNIGFRRSAMAEGGG